jgi:hypothetical protein
MEKLALAGEGEGCTSTPFHSIYRLVQSCGVRSSWEGRHTPPISTLPCIYSVVNPFSTFGYLIHVYWLLLVHQIICWPISTFEQFICLSVWMFVFLSVYLFICPPSVPLHFSFFVCLFRFSVYILLVCFTFKFFCYYLITLLTYLLPTFLSIYLAACSTLKSFRQYYYHCRFFVLLLSRLSIILPPEFRTKSPPTPPPPKKKGPAILK